MLSIILSYCSKDEDELFCLTENVDDANLEMNTWSDGGTFWCEREKNTWSDGGFLFDLNERRTHGGLQSYVFAVLT